MEKRCGPSPLTRTDEFGQAMKTYGEILQACKVPPEDVQRQLIGLQDPKTPERQILNFINLTQELQTASLFKNSRK
ncbi:MAG: hypothetical protein U1E54_02990 [Candidatus Levybacteria bacterium]|nr:hypothetical protein [Candidatus Levybacteria bacterium]